jgi:hypothetical protein
MYTNARSKSVCWTCKDFLKNETGIPCIEKLFDWDIPQNQQRTPRAIAELQLAPQQPQRIRNRRTTTVTKQQNPQPQARKIYARRTTTTEREQQSLTSPRPPQTQRVLRNHRLTIDQQTPAQEEGEEGAVGGAIGIGNIGSPQHRTALSNVRIVSPPASADLRHSSLRGNAKGSSISSSTTSAPITLSPSSGTAFNIFASTSGNSSVRSWAHPSNSSGSNAVHRSSPLHAGAGTIFSASDLDRALSLARPQPSTSQATTSVETGAILGTGQSSSSITNRSQLLEAVDVVDTNTNINKYECVGGARRRPPRIITIEGTIEEVNEKEYKFYNSPPPSASPKHQQDTEQSAASVCKIEEGAVGGVAVGGSPVRVHHRDGKFYFSYMQTQMKIHYFRFHFIWSTFVH